jgi:stress responsive alpha/beta barrel protein
MIRHIVMFNWKPDVPGDIATQVRAGFDHMRDVIPQVVSMQCGPDLGLAEGNFDYAMVADFQSAEDWRTYRDHPEHIAFFQRFGPFAAGATRVQLEI